MLILLLLFSRTTDLHDQWQDGRRTNGAKRMDRYLTNRGSENMHRMVGMLRVITSGIVLMRTTLVTITFMLLTGCATVDPLF